MTNENRSVGVLGGGISGLSVAYGLAQKGITATVHEKDSEVGGVIKTAQQGNWLVEEGPNTLMVKDDKLWNLLSELELEDEVLEANTEAKKRFIIKNHSPVAAPLSFWDFLRTPLLSASAKIRLLKEPFVEKSAEQDESIARFISRRLGQEPLDYAVNPFVSGIYAGDPKSLSVKHTFSKLWEMEQQHGSLFKSVIKRDKSSPSRRALISFKQGLQQLPQAMAKVLRGQIHTSTEITSITKKGDQWVLTGTTNGNSFKHSYDYLISTLPAFALRDIFEDSRLNDFTNLSYVPMRMLALGFRKEQIAHPLNGFGMLAPEVENLSFLGSLFSSTLFHGRAPKRHHLLTCFVGGARQPELARISQKQLLPIILQELNELIGLQGDPVIVHDRYWEKAIPQYEVGYNRFLALMEEFEQEHSGLYLEGSFRGGVSVPDCILSALKTANKVSEDLQPL